MNQLCIYVNQISERLSYTFDFVFKQHGIDYTLTNDVNTFLSTIGNRFNYSEQELVGIPQFIPSTLLFEESIRKDVLVEKMNWNTLETLAFDGYVDPFSAIFYVLSRYEEYTNPVRDEHDRFEASSSILLEYNWLHIQIVERWVNACHQFCFSDENFIHQDQSPNYTVIPTFDIDNTFAFKWKIGWRKWGAIAKDYVHQHKDRIALRKEVLSGNTHDPYDTFEHIQSVIERFPATVLFWHLGNYGKYDRNISWENSNHQQLIRSFSEKTTVGLHPSYTSNYSDIGLEKEKIRIETITNQKSTDFRQHFLKLKIPQTYQRAIRFGFKKDYTMGYADQPGFRAGTAHPFYFFDLSTNQPTDLTIIPFVYMDGTFRDYMNCTIDEAKQHILGLVEEVKKYGGVFSFIWHNETIGTAEKWIGWSEVLEFTLAQFENESD